MTDTIEKTKDTTDLYKSHSWPAAATYYETPLVIERGEGMHVWDEDPEADWDDVKNFAKAISEQHANEDPKRLTTNMSKTKRRGKIFIDYLRNGRGQTAIASYSLRAREGAPVAVPVRWDELGDALHSDRYNIENLRRRLGALTDDPWEGFFDARTAITKKMREAVGLEGVA